ncbi:MAG: glycosyltransferase family 39 protein [Methylococcales bacterium]|nr:glycosyltransferase family 39 protein [Methylococcales bacterium]
MYFSIVVGLLVVIRISLFIYFIVIDGQYLAEDSFLYTQLAHNILEHQIFSTEVNPPLELDVFRTPGFPLFLALLDFLEMKGGYWVAFWHEVIYGFVIWSFYRLSLPLFGKNIVRAGVLFLLIEPGGLAYPKFILSETLFLSFFIVGLLLVGWYLKKRDWRYLVLSGLILGIGTLVRPALLYFPLVICSVLIAFDFRNRQRWIHAGLLFLTISITVSPWMMRNQQHFGSFFISGQQSNMFANYHVPIVWEGSKGIPFNEGYKIIDQLVDVEVKRQEKQKKRPLSLVEFFKVQQNVAFKELAKYPGNYAKQWVFGVLKVMIGMNITEVYSNLKMQPNRVRFFEIQDPVFITKVLTFLMAQDKLVLLEVILRGIITVFALLGALSIISRKDCFLWIMMLANFYFICIPGPMGNPRFRFPVEVFWFVQSYLGFLWIKSFWDNRQLNR